MVGLYRKMYFEGETEKRIKEPASIVGVMIFSVIFMVTIGVYPEPIIQFVETDYAFNKLQLCLKLCKTY